MSHQDSVLKIPKQFKRNNIWDKVDFSFYGEVETEAVRALYKNPEYNSKTFDISNFKKFEETYVRQNAEVIKRFKFTQIENIENLDLSKTGFNKNLKIQ